MAALVLIGTLTESALAVPPTGSWSWDFGVRISREEDVEKVVDVSGTWRSSSGAVVIIEPHQFRPHQTFSMTIKLGPGKSSKYLGQWQEGFRQSFTFQYGSEGVAVGIVNPSDGTIAVALGKKWQSKWVRIAEPKTVSSPLQPPTGSSAFQRTATMGVSKLPPLPETYALKGDQASLVGRLGPPQHFVIATENKSRCELWQWTKPPSSDPLLAWDFKPTQASFVDGKLLRFESLPAPSPKVSSLGSTGTGMRPWQFSSKLTSSQLQRQWGAPDATFRMKTVLFGSLEAFNYRNQMVVIFSEGQFWGAHSLFAAGGNR